MFGLDSLTSLSPYFEKYAAQFGSITNENPNISSGVLATGLSAADGDGVGIVETGLNFLAARDLFSDGSANLLTKAWMAKETYEVAKYQTGSTLGAIAAAIGAYYGVGKMENSIQAAMAVKQQQPGGMN